MDIFMFRRSYDYSLKCVSLLLLLVHMNLVSALEEPRQEIYLQPRNFNPHPYQVDVGASRQTPSNTGPILFPPSPAPDQERSNFIRVENNRNIGHPVDSHPYPKVARKYRFRNPGRYQQYDNQINPQISRALSNHAKKVLGQSVLLAPVSLDEQKNYAFSYKVVDHLTGDDFSHTQSQNEKATSGEYRVKLPDGRVQIVSYTADKNGYKADVKYQDIEKPHQKVPLQHAQDYRNQIESYTNIENERQGYDHRGNRGGIEFGLRATPAAPIQENRIEDYDYGQKRKQAVYAPIPTQTTGLIFAVTQLPFTDYHQASLLQQEAAQPSLNLDYRDVQRDAHRHPPVPHRFRIIPQDKVEIVNQGAASQGSTVAPAYLENPGIILSSTASPPPSFSGDYQHIFVTNIPNLYSEKK